VSNTLVALRHEIARAAFASGAVEMVARVLTILLSVTVARALDPHDVGLLGLAVIVVGTLSFIAGCAETACVISHSGGSDRQYAWTAVVIRGAVTGIFLALVPLGLARIGQMVAAPEGGVPAELDAIVRLLLWQVVLEVAGTYPRVLLQRRLDLTYLSGATLLQVVTQVTLSVLLLWKGYGIPGVVCAMLGATGMSDVFLWARVLRQPVLEEVSRGESGRWRQAAVSTGKVFVAAFVGYLNGRLDNLLVAAVVGPASMSFYAMAWSASRIPISVLIQGVHSVLVPTVARIQGDDERVRRVLRESLRHSYLLLAPVVAVLCVSGASLVAAVLGTKWLPLVPCLRVMSVSILMAPLAVICNAVLVGTGRPHVTGAASGAQLCAIVVLVPPLVRLWGIVGAAVADAVSMTILTVVLFVIVRGVVPKVKWELVTSAGVPILAALSVSLLALSLGGQFPLGLSRLACEVAAIAIGYPAVIAALGGRARLAEFVVLLRDVSVRAGGARVSV
jgi:PST family polysaccharide transporter